MNLRKEWNKLDKILSEYEYKKYIICKNSNYTESKKIKRMFKKYSQLTKIYESNSTNHRPTT